MKEEEKVHIDNIFRDGLQAENVKIPYQESNWAELEARLNRHDRRKGLVFWLRPLGRVAALLLLALAGWWLWPQKESAVPETVVAAQEAEKPVETSPQAESAVSVAAAQQDKSSVEKEGKVPKSLPFVAQEKTVIAEIGEGENQVTRKMNLLASRGRLPGFVDNSAELSATKLDPVKSIKPVSMTIEQSPKDVPLKLEDEPKSSKMAITVLAAPAYNGVNNLNNAKIGGDFGLLYSVALSKRWIVSAGAIYALKLYEADGDSYNSDSNGSYGSSPIMVNADCRVLDVPLNIDYKLLNLPKMSFSLGTGVSSYFMLREKYSYQYAYEPEQKDAVSLKNNSIHWASVLNLQASVERQLSPQISVSLRPYLKVPFQDIGYGRVRLQSFGIALATSFHF